jgi:polyhydroxyalkanoate synthesis regulator phasin
MAGLGDLVQKAFYLGVGIASYAGEKAGGTLNDARLQAQKILDELVARGELTAEEAQNMINEMMQKAQQTPPVTSSQTPEPPSQPRRIEILADEEDAATPEARQAEALRQQVTALREQLEALKQQQS